MSHPIPIASTRVASMHQRSTGGSGHFSNTGSPSLPNLLNQVMQAASPADAQRQQAITQMQQTPTTLDEDLTMPAHPAPILTQTAPESQPVSRSSSAENLKQFYARGNDGVNSSDSPQTAVTAPSIPGHTAVMPSHPPPPPPGASAPPPPPSIQPNTTPRGSLSNPAGATAAPLSPKTSKLLRRINRLQQELEELTLENELLKEANRRANEEKAVREQEKRVEAKKRAEQEQAREKEIEELRQQLHQLTHDAAETKHDPLECARTIAELTEMLQLREEQLELINLDRSKLYEEIETWKIGMERLASLQAYGTSPPNRTTIETATPTNGPSVLPVHVQVDQHASGSATPSTSSSSSSSVVNLVSLTPFPPAPLPLEEAGVFARSTSEFKADAEEDTGRLMSSVLMKPGEGVMQISELTTPIAPSSPSHPDFQPFVEEEIWQNQRLDPFFGFQPTSAPFMRPAFSDEAGGVAKTFESVTLPPGWVWEEPWTLDRSEREEAEGEEKGVAAKREDEEGGMHERLAKLRASMGLGKKSSSTPASSVGTDQEGWRYSIQFKLFAWHSHRGRLDTVRRRRWKRRRCFVGIQATEAMLQNALKAIEASGGPSALTLLRTDSDEATKGSSDGAGETDKPSVASLAAAYSSGAAGDSFSMFTSFPPPEVAGTSDQQASAKALEALLRLAGKEEEAAQLAAATTTTAAAGKTVASASSSSSTAAAVSNSSASSSTNTTPTPSSSSGGMIAGLSSYLANTRVVSWVSRKSVAPTSSESTPAASPLAGNGDGGNVMSPDSPLNAHAAAISPVCSFCTQPAKKAMQYAHPQTSLLLPLVSFCHKHYHAALKYVTLELQVSNPDPLSDEELKKRDEGHKPPNVCEYCDSLETFPVQILHLAVTEASAPPAVAPAPSCEVLDSNEAYRFCAKHMTPFIQLVQAFRPTSPEASPTVTANSFSSETEMKEMTSEAAPEVEKDSPSARNPFSAQAAAPRIQSPTAAPPHQPLPEQESDVDL